MHLNFLTEKGRLLTHEEIEEMVKDALKDFDHTRFFKLDTPDWICLNCGCQCGLGECCDNPNVVIMKKETVSPETWEQIQELINNPPAPTQKLRQIMQRERFT